jgi:hypothetical protein
MGLYCLVEFTGGASSSQWNLALELRHPALFAAYTNEMREMLEGRFHDHPEKSHAHDGTSFTLPGSWRAGWARFGPYSTSSTTDPMPRPTFCNSLPTPGTRYISP